MKGSQVFRNPVVLYHDKKNNNYYIKKNLVSILKVGLKATIHEATMCIVACKNANMLPVIRTPVYSKLLVNFEGSTCCFVYGGLKYHTVTSTFGFF